MKPAYYWFGLLAALMIICAVMLPRRDVPTSIPETRSIPKTPSHAEQVSQDSRLPHPNQPVSDMAARLRQEQAGRRFRQEEGRREVQRDIEKRSAATGESTNVLWRLWEESLISPEEQKRRWAAEKAQHREEDLANGVNQEMWDWEDKLDQVSEKLKKGMNLQEVGQLLGSPTKAQAQVQRPGVLALVPVPLDQVETFQGPLTLIYLPHPKERISGTSGISDVFRTMHVDIGADKTLVSFYYVTLGLW